MTQHKNLKTIPNQRHLFDIPDDIAYFNCAYMSPQLRSVRESGHSAVDCKSQPWKIVADDFFADSELARALFAKIISANADDVAIIPSVSYGTAIAAAIIEINAGDEILLLEEQFPSNVYPWRELAMRNDVNITTVPRPTDFDWTRDIVAAITPKTRVAALPHVHWTDGSSIDLKKVSAACKAANAALVLDVTQSVGALPISVRDVQPDFLISAAYKWLLGPYSLGFMYMHPKYQNRRPLENNWLNRKDSEEFSGLVNYRDDFQNGARRFDVGERSNFALMPMAVTALKQVLAWTPEAIQKTLTQFTDRITVETAKLGLSPIPKDRRAGHLLGVRFPDKLPDGIQQHLMHHNVYVSIRGNAIRIAPHLYNSENDMDRLITALAESL